MNGTRRGIAGAFRGAWGLTVPIGVGSGRGFRPDNIFYDQMDGDCARILGMC